MPRRNRPRNKRVQVTREVFALASLVAYRAHEQQQPDGDFLPGRVFGSRSITRRMMKALRAQAV